MNTAAIAALFCGMCGTLVKPGVGCPRCDGERVNAWQNTHGEVGEVLEGL